MAGVKQNPKDVTVIACPVSTGGAQPHLIHTLVHSQGCWIRAVLHHPLVGTSKRLPSVLYLTEFSDRVSSRPNRARQMPYDIIDMQENTKEYGKTLRQTRPSTGLAITSLSETRAVFESYFFRVVRVHLSSCLDIKYQGLQA